MPFDDPPALPSGTMAPDCAPDVAAWGAGLAEGGVCFFSQPENTPLMQIRINSLRLMIEGLNLVLHG